MSIGLFSQSRPAFFVSQLPAALLFLQQPFIAQIHGKGTKGSRQHDSQHRHGKHSIAAGKAQCQRNAANGSLHGCLGGIVNKRADDGIVAGVLPVADWFSFWIALQFQHIVHYIPRAIYIKVAKMIAIVPFLDVFGLLSQIGILQQLVNLTLYKPEGL